VIDPAAAPEEKIILAGQGCPTEAISITRDGEKVV
jgi:ferredoxin